MRKLTLILAAVSLIACNKAADSSKDKDSKSEKPSKSDKSDRDKDDETPKFECGDKLARLGKLDKSEYTIKCAKGCTSGSVWGDGWYTTDSAVCVAAVHAGKIEADKGGTVKIELEKGLGAYSGSTKNGVTSSGWGQYGKSFSVDGSKNANADASEFTCKDTLSKIGTKKSATITCPKGCSSGTIYGTDTYTGDSAVCVAAVHAGKIKADDGGEVKIKVVPGLDKYVSSEKNGVKSLGWGKWGTAFEFE